MTYVIGIDIGTSALKTLVVNKSGDVVESYSVSYNTAHPKSGYSEIDPGIWYEATLESLKHILNHYTHNDISGISFSGQMHGLVVIDQEGNPIRPAILWNDTRTSQEVEDIKQNLGLNSLLQLTQNTVLEGFTLPKLMWLKNNEQDNYKRISKFMLPKDYIVYKLTGNVYTEPSDAAGTIMFSVKDENWSTELLHRLNIDPSICPEIIASHQKSGQLTEKVKNTLGIDSNINVYQGGADNACGALGSGITDEQKQLVSIGTSGVALSIENRTDYENDGNVHYFNHCVPNQKYIMGVTLSAGYSLEWLKQLISADENFTTFLKDINQSEVGANGLMYTPYLLGERTPHNDASVRGSFIGLDANTTQLDMKRAVIEGITYSINESIQIMKNNAININEIVSIGGGAKNNQWLQIQADIFNTTITTRTEEQGPAYGAAMIAAMGEQWFNTFNEMSEAWIAYHQKVYPIETNTKSYQDLFNIYKTIYDATQPVTQKLNKFK
ncbi:xylulokinase [Staphylococcus xylosus]|uniref:xylulokinase n=1 Tax=Staphylococcus xylosus TaxID=1288 RepID=UPI001C1DDF50|nr:xylulokinase [Staphylococcus xylosus]MBU6133823.1 xylulokinase [Staphylococcus xylosus]MEB8151265.1 xylulokinase [Staphylococcus xylosus]